MNGQAPSPFDLGQPRAYAQWREARLAEQPQRLDDLIVEVADPRRLSDAERDALLRTCARANMAIYRSPIVEEDKSLPRLLGAQLGLHRLDANWLADEDGISPIAVSAARPGARADFIPYTDKPIRWHSDGYYHPEARRIEGMILHCVRAAGEGGVSGMVNHDRLYIELRDANPAWVRALMAPDAMTIPERTDEQGVARPEQSGPVFTVVSAGTGLHMRYTARTRSIAWKDDADTRAAVAYLEKLLASDVPWIFRTTLQPGMGIVSNNVPHERSAFTDDPRSPRLLYRARFLDRVGPAPLDDAGDSGTLALPELAE
ncbi:MAG: TauD/TfdA family dioxygenase [Hydrogenophaga sp.]|nr:TauD/TfdA family dioxygenase [Hydrogenophaga sp.]